MWGPNRILQGLVQMGLCGVQTGHSCMPFYPMKWVLSLVLFIHVLMYYDLLVHLGIFCLIIILYKYKSLSEYVQQIQNVRQVLFLFIICPFWVLKAQKLLTLTWSWFHVSQGLGFFLWSCLVHHELQHSLAHYHTHYVCHWPFQSIQWGLCCPFSPFPCSFFLMVHVCLCASYMCLEHPIVLY